ncbi:MAG: right-handed parallel beta-helix repeat-containing protein [Bacteroidales bacterium]
MERIESRRSSGNKAPIIRLGIRRHALIPVLSFFFIISGFAEKIIVNNTLNSGSGTLRDAIWQANQTSTSDTIIFNIPLTDPGCNNGIFTITLFESLPAIINGPVFIDGGSQTLFTGNTNPAGPEIHITTFDTLQYGFCLYSWQNRIDGLCITGFQTGIIIYGEYAQNNFVTNCYIGADPSGKYSIPNVTGIYLSKANNTIIENNLISGNTDAAIVLNGKGTANNLIRGNKIGVDSSGKQILFNNKGIVMKSLANGNIIGGTALSDRNIISGNLEIGIYIEACDSNLVIGNLIGTDITGKNKVSSGDTLIQGNGIEFNTVASHNRLGGSNPGERNVISGNKVYGVVYYGNCNNNTTEVNFIGTDISGTMPLPNATGVCLDCGSNHNRILGNLISGNQNYGIFFVTRATSFNTCSGNIIGLNITGTDTIPNEIGLVIGTGSSDNLIGGETEAERNIISGNRQSGIMVTNHLTINNLIKGNFIGTGLSGNNGLGNKYGVMMTTFSSHTTLEKNLISGNHSDGVILYEHADSNVIATNSIGTTFSGDFLGNGGNGIVIYQESCNNRVGGVGNGNTIANNGGNGILVIDNGSFNNRISANSIFRNGKAGIELMPEGVNPIDTLLNRIGPNMCMNYPVIHQALFGAGSNYTVLSGKVSSRHPAKSMVELFKANPDSNGFGEGAEFLGIATPDSSGSWSVSIPGLNISDIITSTATDENGNTSEFSQNISVATGINEETAIIGSLQVFPNPVKGCCTISFELAERCQMDWVICTIRGDEIISGQAISSGKFSYQWCGQTKNGIKSSNGIYLFILKEAGKTIASRKILFYPDSRQ